jgi:hypothetical protein
MMNRETTIVVKGKASGSDSASGNTGTTANPSTVRVLAGQGGIKDWQEDVHHTIHHHPELANQELKTSAAAADSLRAAGYEVHDKIGTAGVVGILKNGDGPTVLMRADMDALPMREETGLPYASTDHETDGSGWTPKASNSQLTDCAAHPSPAIRFWVWCSR